MSIVAQNKPVTPSEKRAAKIRAALILRGIKVVDLAKHIGVSQPLVSDTIAGRRHSEVVRKAVADAIDEDYATLWPDPPPPRGRPPKHTEDT